MRSLLAFTRRARSRPERRQSTTSSKRFEREGCFVVPGLLKEDEANTLREAIDALSAANVPPIFVFAYDEAWNAVARARDLVRTTGTAYDLLADMWAWRVPLGARG